MEAQDCCALTRFVHCWAQAGRVDGRVVCAVVKDAKRAEKKNKLVLIVSECG